MKSIRFLTWPEFVAKLPFSRRTAERWLAGGRLKVSVWQPGGLGGKRYVSEDEAERVLREIAGEPPPPR
jgi:predicted site-specific integrase-resolvase